MHVDPAAYMVRRGLTRHVRNRVIYLPEAPPIRHLITGIQARRTKADGLTMLNSQRIFVDAVKRYCAKRAIAVEVRADGWLIVMQRGARRRFAFGYDVGLNSAVAHRIANDKSATADVLKMSGVACVPHALFLGPGGTGKSHLAQAIGQAAIQQGYRVLYRETHKLLDDLAEATIDGTRKEHMELLASVPLLIIDDLGMRKLPVTAAEELLEIVMRRYERTSTLLTSNRPVEDWGKLLGDSAAVTAMLDRLLHHGHVLKCGPRSWRTKIDLPPQEAAG